VTSAKKPTAAKKTTPARKRVVRERKLGAVVLSVVEPKPARPRKRATTVKTVAERTVEVAPQPRPDKVARPLVAKVRARRKVVLPFRERLEEAMHRELKHKGPVCHPCRMNGSRLATLAVS
jgi:hypothetical protein